MNIKDVNITLRGDNYCEVAINGVGTICFSYDVKICAKTPAGVLLDNTYWNYSKTTSKHRNLFLDEKLEDTKKKIKNGEYKLIDLN